MFDHLSAAYTQATRLLRLTTTLGADVLLAESVRAEEAISLPFTLNISALSQDAALPLRSLVGKPALLELLTADAGASRPFHGYITTAEACGSNGGLARYALTLQPWTAFAALGRDSRAFHDMRVTDILDAVFAAYQVSGKLAPAWRWEIADRSVYPVRSLTTQYQESNLDFVARLMSEAGLFYYFEHTGDRASTGLGVHTLIIADHNDAFQPNRQAHMRFTQPGAVMTDDSIDRWRSQSRLQTNAVELSSWDYRTLNTRPVSATGTPQGAAMLTDRDTPGVYAYPSREQGLHAAMVRMQALEAGRKVFTGAGTVRTLAPGTTFTLTGHAVHDQAASDDARTFAITRTVHLMHNNLSAELRAEVTERLGPSALDKLLDIEHADSVHRPSAAPGERPIYRNRIDAIPWRVPFRAPLLPRPVIKGQQSAVVVGPAGAAVHTDRDHRVKIQFHWQRDGGARTSHSRLTHPSPDGHAGAPADDTAGTWVRVASALGAIAGVNWGSNALPRVGQEVLVDFLEGDIDRPVVIGTLYNGRGMADAPGNQISTGAGAATANAPAWFPGNGSGHAHAAVLTGLKSQAMQTSGSGHGAYCQLVFDDTAGKARLALQHHAAPHAGTAELNLGQLRHQAGNQLLHPAGFGAELTTEHSAALRAGRGMLLSAAASPGPQMDSSDAHTQMAASKDLQQSLAALAREHNAKLKDAAGADEAAPAKLPAITDLAASASIVAGEETRSADAGGGSAPAYGAPHFQLSAPAGIAAMTPGDAVLSAGASSSITAGYDVNSVAQGNLFALVKAGISLFTYGKASNGDKPNQEAGVMLHAASGKVSSQSQAGPTSITADKTITVASVTKTVTVAAKQHVLLTAQGACLKLKGGNIMLHGPGKIEFKASKKDLAGPQSNATDLTRMPAFAPMASVEARGGYTGRFVMNKNRDAAFQGYRYRIESLGTILAQGKSSSKGETAWIDTATRTPVEAFKTIMRDDQKIEENWAAALEKAAAGHTSVADLVPTPLDDEYLDLYGDHD